jgi:hypothetical protein
MSNEAISSTENTDALKINVPHSHSNAATLELLNGWKRCRKQAGCPELVTFCIEYVPLKKPSYSCSKNM